MDRSTIRDIALLITRLILGVIFIAHGWDKLFIAGTEKSTELFVTLGIPQPGLTVWLVSLVELIGGALLILGLLAPTVSMVLILDMVGALWSAHITNGLFMRDNGSELGLALISSLLLIFVFGSGKLSLDRLFAR